MNDIRENLHEMLHKFLYNSNLIFKNLNKDALLEIDLIINKRDQFQSDDFKSCYSSFYIEKFRICCLLNFFSTKVYYYYITGIWGIALKVISIFISRLR